MKSKRGNAADALGAALLALALAGCAAGPSATATDPTARQEANREKQKALTEMLEEGRRD